MARLGHDNLDEPIAGHARPVLTLLRAGQTVGEALASLRGQDIGEKIIYFYVVDADGKLAGVVPTRRLLMAMPQAQIETIMVSRVVSIPDKASVLDACEFFVMYRLLAFPVVDADNKLLGVVDVSLFTDEMFGVSERQSSDDLFQLIGVHVTAARQGSPWAGFRDRFPWLLCNIGGGIACAFLSSRYEALLDHVIVLALFIPVVLALAESVSMQSMTLTLQSLHETSVDLRRLWRSLRRELLTSLLLAAACGVVVGLVAVIWKRQMSVALAISGSIALAIVTACLLGVLLPTLVRVLKGDPRIAAGPVVLATADVLTLLFYFNLAGWLLQRTVTG